MDKLTISAEWQDKERLKVIAWLANKIRRDANENSARDYAERILYVATRPASFLNANRLSIFDESKR
jgi:hypothetical protein